MGSLSGQGVIALHLSQLCAVGVPQPLQGWAGGRAEQAVCLRELGSLPQVAPRICLCATCLHTFSLIQLHNNPGKGGEAIILYPSEESGHREWKEIACSSQASLIH